MAKESLDMNMIREFIKTIKSNEFKGELDKLGGYDYKDIGEIINL